MVYESINILSFVRPIQDITAIEKEYLLWVKFRDYNYSEIFGNIQTVESSSRKQFVPDPQWNKDKGKVKILRRGCFSLFRTTLGLALRTSRPVSICS